MILHRVFWVCIHIIFLCVFLWFYTVYFDCVYTSYFCVYFGGFTPCILSVYTHHISVCILVILHRVFWTCIHIIIWDIFVDLHGVLWVCMHIILWCKHKKMDMHHVIRMSLHRVYFLYCERVLTVCITSWQKIWILCGLLVKCLSHNYTKHWSISS